MTTPSTPTLACRLWQASRTALQPLALTFALLVGLAAPAAQAAVTVSNVSAARTPGTKQMVITYDVASDATNAVTVSLVVSNGAAAVACPSVSGHVGAGVPTGTGRSMVWDGGADWNGNVSANLRAYVTADDGASAPPAAEGDYMVVDLSGGPSAASYPVTYLSAVPGGGWTDEYKTTKLVLRRITAGTFTMGSPTDELGRDSGEAQHQVTLTKDFYIGVFEVTQKQWERVMGDWPSYFNNTSFRDSRPLERRSWNDIRGGTWPGGQPAAGTFMQRISSRTGLPLDLPTESQWEYACRAGTGTALNSGKNLTGTRSCPNMAEVGRYHYNHPGGYSRSSGVSTDGGTAKVGSYLPNAWGLYDMHGNVWEWCLDWYEGYPGAVTDPVGAASGSDRVGRGGNWGGYAEDCRSAYRDGDGPVFRFIFFGFRPARTLP